MLKQIINKMPKNKEEENKNVRIFKKSWYKLKIISFIIF